MLSYVTWLGIHLGNSISYKDYPVPSLGSPASLLTPTRAAAAAVAKVQLCIALHRLSQPFTLLLVVLFDWLWWLSKGCLSGA
jgi:hypothetical protein